jgi:hypothetical protein
MRVYMLTERDFEELKTKLDLCSLQPPRPSTDVRPEVLAALHDESARAFTYHVHVWISSVQAAK